MENIKIQPTPKTPLINFSAAEHILELKGRSIPENSLEFFKPLIDWAEKFAIEATRDVNVHIQIE